MSQKKPQFRHSGERQSPEVVENTEFRLSPESRKGSFLTFYETSNLKI